MPQIDIIEILRKYRVPHMLGGQHRHVRAGWVGVDCPDCGPRTQKWHMGISLTNGYSRCWKCGPKSSVQTLARLTRQNPRVVYDWVSSFSKVRKTKHKDGGQYKPPKRLESLAPAHKRYLIERGFDPITIEKHWQVQGISIASRLGWRIFMPIILDGEPVSWTTRTIGTENPRYITATANEEAIPARDLLYGADLARNTIIVVEGPLDAWAIGPGAVATLGLDYTTPQVEMMTRFPNRFIMFDAEETAQKRARELATILADYPGRTTTIELESGKDAAEADEKEIAEIRQLFLENEI